MQVGIFWISDVTHHPTAGWMRAEQLVGRIERAWRELASSMAATSQETLVDPFGNPPPFEQLLGSYVRSEARE